VLGVSAEQDFDEDDQIFLGDKRVNVLARPWSWRYSDGDYAGSFHAAGNAVGLMVEDR